MGIVVAHTCIMTTLLVLSIEAARCFTINEVKK